MLVGAVVGDLVLFVLPGYATGAFLMGAEARVGRCTGDEVIGIGRGLIGEATGIERGTGGGVISIGRGTGGNDTG